MTVFYITLIVVYIFSVIARVIQKKHSNMAWIFVVVIILILSLVSGFRGGIGDTPAYNHLYTLIEPGYDANGGYEEGFIFLLKVLKTFSDEPQFMLIVTAIITNALNVISMYIFTKDGYFEIATFLYITSGYYTVTMNGLRQCLAASIIFLATIFIIKGKFIPYIITIVLMITIHNSAFVMIPMYFIVREKVWCKKTNILYGVMLVGLFFYDPIMQMLQGSKYGAYSDFNEGGASPIRILVFLVPIVLAFLKKDTIRKKWESGDIFINMTTICGIVMLFSAFNWIFARFTIYFQPYTFIVFAYILKQCFSGKERRVLYFGLVSCYFIFFYYDQVISLNMSYRSAVDLKKFLFY